MPVYLLNGDQVPAPVIPTDFLDPQDASPTTGPTLPTGTTAGLSTRFNQLSAKVDALGREGAGGRCVLRGLELSDSGTPLTVAISAGQAAIDGPVTLPDGDTAVVPDDLYDEGDVTVRAHIWITQAGTPAVVSNDLTPPSDDCVYRGSCRTLDGAFVDFDYSGVFYRLQGGPLFRRTADAGEPADTPPSDISFYAQTAGGLYLWTGAQWVDTGFDSKTVLTSLDHATAGALEDVLAAGDGITLATVETSPGQWQVVITNSGLSEETDLTAYLKRDGSNAMTNPLNFGGYKGVALGTPTNPTDAATKQYADTAATNAANTISLTPYTKVDGSRAFTGNQSMGGNKLTNLGTPTADTDATTKEYVDDAVAGFSTTDQKALVSPSDTTSATLSEKIGVNRGLATSITGTGDETFNINLDKHQETLPAHSVTILPGESVILDINFSNRGSFPDEDSYSISVWFDNITSGSMGHINEWATIRELSGHYGDAPNGLLHREKTGTRCLVEITNHSPELLEPFDVSSHNFRAVVILAGTGWVAGGSPSGTPTVTEYRYASRKTLEFTLDPVTIPKGGSGTVEVDFSGLGRFSGGYFVKAVPANGDAQVWELCSGRETSSCHLRVENAADAASSSVTLTVTLQGERFLASDATLNPDATGDPTATVIASSNEREPYDIGLSWLAAPEAAQSMLLFVAPRTLYLGGATTLADSTAYISGSISSTEHIYVYHYPTGSSRVLIGDIICASSGVTFDFDAEVEIAPGEVLQLEKDGTGSSAINAIALTLVAEKDRT